MKEKSLFKKVISLGLVLALSLMLLAGCSGTSDNAGDPPSDSTEAGKDMKIKISTVLTELSPTGQALALLQKNLSERTDGRIVVEILYNGVIGADQATEMIQSGDLQMMTQTPLAVEVQVPALATLNQYYMFDDLAHAHRFLEGEGGEFLYKEWNSMGMEALTTLALGFRQLGNSKREVASVEDIKGLSIRGYSPIQIAAWQAVGAIPTSVDWGELFVSLQQGLIDGEEGAISNFEDFSFYEVMKYLTLTDHVFSCDMLVAGTNWLETLSDEDELIIREEVDKMYEWHKEAYQAYQKALLEKFGNEYGVTVTEMPADQKAEMAKLMGDVTKKDIVKVCGQEVYDKVKGYVDAAK